MGTIGRHPPTVHRRRLDGRRSRPKTPKDDRHVEGQGRTGLFGRRLLLDDLRTDYQPRRRQHGFIKRIYELLVENKITAAKTYAAADLEKAAAAVDIFDAAWTEAAEELTDLKPDGQLVYFVTSDLYHLYEKYLDSFANTEAAYIGRTEGRPVLTYHGIPVVDLHLSSYLRDTTYAQSFCLLTDRRNLVLAVNTSDFPGNEIRMWYNPDLMENRQRAVFMAGCDVLDEKLVSFRGIRAHRRPLGLRRDADGR